MSAPRVDWNGGEMPEAFAKATARTHIPANDILESSEGLRVVVNDDGSVDIDQPAPAVKRDRSQDRFDANLAEEESSANLNAIAMDYLDGVAQDILSRSQFIANWNRGVDLLGLRIEDPSATRGSRQSISRVKNPSLLKACVRSQSLARGQLLPATGPAKVMEIAGGSDRLDDLARNFEDDFNYYLTDVAKEYYPNTDQALFWRAFGGSMYKKVYRCPLRQRPVSDAVQLDSLIVSEDARSLSDATRKTQEIQVSPVMMRRMQLDGGWLDIPLPTPQPTTNPMKRKVLESQGITAASTRPYDISYNVYEGYCFLDPRDYGIDEPDAPEGLPLPYRVVIDKDSQRVLALHRNWTKGDDRFREKSTFVKYGLVPGLGFLDYGYLHLIGNQTRVMTAIQQILIDHGMIANFPAGMKTKGVRTSTNEINPSLGEWVEVDIGNVDDIRKSMMAMPYGPIDASLIDMYKLLSDDVEKMSGTVEIETGAERTNMPVGTVLAMIEQQSQDLTAVHQRDHRSQKEELCLLRDVFRDNPQDLHWLSRGGSRDYTKLLEEFADLELSPASDPNVPSQAHRIMLSQFLLQTVEKAPQFFKGQMRQIIVRSLEAVGINDADSLPDSQEQIEQAMAQQGQQGGGGQSASAAASLQRAQMEMPLKQAKLQVDAQKVQVAQENLRRQAANEAEDHQQSDEHHQAEMAVEAVKLRQAEDKLAQDQTEAQPDAEDDANLRALNAKAFASMGTGAMGFAKAAQTVQQGEAELQGLNTELGGKAQDGVLQKRNVKRKSNTSKRSTPDAG